jgi:hypothetical protein
MLHLEQRASLGDRAHAQTHSPVTLSSSHSQRHQLQDTSTGSRGKAHSRSVQLACI